MYAALALAAALAAGQGQEPVKVALSGGGRFEVGQSVRAEVTAEEDGHLLVLQASPDGAVRVLFPIDPGDDAFVKGGGRTYQLRDRGGRPEVFRAGNRAGRGLVLVALTPSPLNVDGSSENGHWDYRQLAIGNKEDLEAGLVRLANRLAGPQLRYDVASYGVDDPYSYADYRGYPAGYLGAWAGYGAGWGWPGSFGWGYSPFLWDPWFGGGYFGLGGFGFGGFGFGGLGFGWPYGLGWGYGFGGFYPGFIGGVARPALPYGGRFADRSWRGARTFNGGVVNPSRGSFSGAVRPSFGGVRPSFGGARPSFGGGHGSGGRSWGGRRR